MENSPCFSAVLYFRFCISSFSKNDRPTIFLWDCCKIIVPRKIVAAEIFAGSSGVADAELFQSPGRGPVASEIPGLRKFLAAFRKLHPRTCFYPPQNDVLPIANHILPAAKQCLAFNENCGKESCGFNHGRNCRPHFRPACTGSEYNALLRLYSYFQVYSYNNCWTRDVRPTISDA